MPGAPSRHLESRMARQRESKPRHVLRSSSTALLHRTAELVRLWTPSFARHLIMSGMTNLDVSSLALCAAFPRLFVSESRRSVCLHD